MIEVILQERCTGCGVCVAVCPTNVFDVSSTGTPAIARPDACQTCFMCELYCKADAIFVGPECDHRTGVDEAAIATSGLLGQYRRDSGWDEWGDDPRFANEHWQMENIFARARAAAGP